MEWSIPPCSPGQARALAAALAISETTASVLARRGYADPERARAFLAAELPGHDPSLLGDLTEACERLSRAVACGTRICVHGDYDVDGICATALAVLALRELGADVSWHLPSRFEEGYGLTSQTLARLAEEEVGLVLTVDCGITAVEEVAEARKLGMEVIVTDHHRPKATLPDCLVVATRPSRYPFPELCGTGVAYKLMAALMGEERLEPYLDLVALATIADVVPLVDENRALAARGLKALARTRRPGLRALMASAGVDPAAADEAAVAYRLAPRINASGRLCHPELALELLLTESEEEAARLARRLEQLNRERQEVEERILRQAVERIESWPAGKRAQRAYVLADEDWHEGVIGIVASRLVERYRRPVVLIAGSDGADGAWKGSGRSIAAFDLHAGLAAASSHLEQFGGHRAAAGLSVRPERVEAFASAFVAHADSVLGEEDLAPRTVVDAVVRGRALTLDLAEELGRLAPFGLGNPPVTLLLAGCRLADLETVGDGRHLRFRVYEQGRRVASGVAFGMGTQLDRLRRPGLYDVAFRLEQNRWNGTVAPQIVARRILDTPDRYVELRARLAEEWKEGEGAWSAEARAIFSELELEAGGWRSLLESETFRALLAQPDGLRRAA